LQGPVLLAPPIPATVYAQHSTLSPRAALSFKRPFNYVSFVIVHTKFDQGGVEIVTADGSASHG
jgi:hypothetical protein